MAPQQSWNCWQDIVPEPFKEDNLKLPVVECPGEIFVSGLQILSPGPDGGLAKYNIRTLVNTIGTIPDDYKFDPHMSDTAWLCMARHIYIYIYT